MNGIIHVIFIHELQCDNLMSPTILSRISKAYGYPQYRTTVIDCEYVLATLNEIHEQEEDVSREKRVDACCALWRKIEKMQGVSQVDVIRIFKHVSILSRSNVDIFFIDAYFLNEKTIAMWKRYFSGKFQGVQFAYHQVGLNTVSSRMMVAVNHGFKTTSLQESEPDKCLDESVKLLSQILNV